MLAMHNYRPPFTIITFVRKYIFTGQEGTRWQYCAYVETILGMPKSKDREIQKFLALAGLPLLRKTGIMLLRELIETFFALIREDDVHA